MNQGFKSRRDDMLVARRDDMLVARRDDMLVEKIDESRVREKIINLISSS